MRVTTIIASALLGVLGCGHHVSRLQRTGDEAALHALLARSTEAENTCNKTAWLATVADDGFALAAAGPVRKEQLAATFEQSFCRPGYHGAVSLDSLEVSGNLAVMWGRLEIRGRRPDGTETKAIGTHIDAARRERDGNWKFTWWMVTSRPVQQPTK